MAKKGKPKKFKKEKKKKKKWAKPPKLHLNVFLIPFILVSFGCLGTFGWLIYNSNINWRLKGEKEDALLTQTRQDALKGEIGKKLTATGASLGLKEAKAIGYYVARNLRDRWIRPGTGPTGDFIRQKEGKKDEPIGVKDPRYIHFLEILEDMFKDLLWWPPKLGRAKHYRGLAEFNKARVAEKKRVIIEAKGKRTLRLNEEIQEAARRHQGAREDYRRNREIRNQQIKQFEEEIAKRKKEYKKVISIKQSSINKLEYEIIQLTKREAKDLSFTEPDGEIVLANNSQGYAWINIGREDGLIKGLRFEVFKRVKGERKILTELRAKHKRKIKGLVDVIMVGESMSKVNILYTFDKRDPITRGDKIITPFFERGKKLVFVMIGEPLNKRLYTNEDVKAAILRAGVRLDEKVTLDTDFLILGRDPKTKKYVREENKDYQKAVQFGVIIMAEEEMFRYIGRMVSVGK